MSGFDCCGKNVADDYKMAGTSCKLIGGAKLIIVSKMFIKPVVRKTLQNAL